MGGKAYTTAPRAAAAITASVVLAACLRLWSLYWGYPFDYHPDEHLVYDSAVLVVQTGQLNPDWIPRPSLLFFLELLPVALLHLVAGIPLEVVTGPGASPGMLPEAQWSYLLAGRIMVALFGVATVGLITATLARMVRSRLTLWLVGLIAALTPLHVLHSHYLTPDVPAAFGVALALYASVRLAGQGGSLWLAVLAGLGVGLGVGFDYLAALAAVPVALALLLAPGPRWRRLVGLGLASLFAAALLFATTPNALLDTEQFLDGLLSGQLGYGTGPFGPAAHGGVLPLIGRLSETRVFGPFLLVGALLAIPLAVSRRLPAGGGRAAAVLACFVVVEAAVGAAGERDLDASAVPMLVALVLMAGLAIDALLTATSSRLLRAGTALTIALFLVPTAWAAGDRDYQLGLVRSETLAYSWFVREVPEGAVIFREWYGPHLPQPRFRVMANYSASSMSSEMLDQAWLTHGEARLDYLVLSSYAFGDFVSEAPGDRDSERRYALYAAVFADPPVACFGPDRDRIAGPEVWVFARSQRARQLHGQRLHVEGVCRTDWPWLARARWRLGG